MRSAQRPPSNVASDGSVWRREAITRAVLAIASARSAARPSQNMASAARVGHGRHEVDLRERGDDDRRRPVGAEDPHVLGQPSGRPPRIVPVVEDPTVAAGHHRDAVGTGDRVQPDDDARRADPALPERRNRRQLIAGGEEWQIEAGTRQALDRSRPERGERGILEHTAPVGVGEHDATLRRREQDPGHARRVRRADLDRVDGSVGETPVDDVDRVETAERAQPDATLADDEVGRLDEVEAEHARQRRVLDVRRLVDATAEHDDARARHRRRGRQRVAQVGGEAADRRQVAAALRPQQLGGHPAHDGAVDQRVADARRGVGEVLHDAPRAVGQGDDVDGVRRQPTRWWRRPDGRQAVAQRRRQHLGRHPSGLHRLAPAVQVGEQHLQRAQAGHDRCGEHVEDLAVEHVRDRVEPPRSVARPPVAVMTWQVVDEVPGQRRADEAVGLDLPPRQREVVGEEPRQQVHGARHGSPPEHRRRARPAPGTRADAPDRSLARTLARLARRTRVGPAGAVTRRPAGTGR